MSRISLSADGPAEPAPFDLFFAMMGMTPEEWEALGRRLGDDEGGAPQLYLFD
jgi:hypothetical protein